MQVATATPVVTTSTTSLPAGSATLSISGAGFDPTAGNNTVAFNNGAVGTVTAASATSLTVKFSTKPTTVGPLTAVVTTNGASSAAVQVAAIVPAVTLNTASLAANAATLTIAGSGFDTTFANNTVALNNGAVGTVTAGTATSLTVTFSTQPTGVGSLTAVVTTDNVSSGTAVQVATVAPAAALSTASLAANAGSIVIDGYDFDATAANDSVTFNDGAVGTVHSATATSLDVTINTAPATAGRLTAVVTTDNVSSGTPLQVATVAPVVSNSAQAWPPMPPSSSSAGRDSTR